jgi:transposase
VFMPFSPLSIAGPTAGASTMFPGLNVLQEYRTGQAGARSVPYARRMVRGVSLTIPPLGGHLI